MKTVIHRLLNGGIASHPPNPAVVAIMTGGGFGWDAERINHETQNFQLPSVEADWAGFSESFAREWVTALSQGGITEDAAFDLFTRRVQVRRGYTASATVEMDDLPSHLTGTTSEARYFRGALVWDDASSVKCSVDMAKARSIHMTQIRKVRDKELVKLDVPWMQAVEAGDTSAQGTIRTQKQTLRDLPATFDITTGVTTPELLLARWPTELPARA